MYRTAVALLIGLMLPTGALAAEKNLPAFGWDWETDRRYFLESSVAGVFLGLSADRNRDVLIRGFTTQVLVRCGSPERENKRSYEIRCDIEDFAIQAMPRISEAGLAQSVLEEMEEKLEDGAWLQIRFSDHGSLINFQLEDYKARSREQNNMAETIRLILMRSFAGLDMSLPRRPMDFEQGVWGQSESAITMYPTNKGTVASVEMVNLAAKRDDAWLVIETAARAAISPQGGNDTYSTKVEARAVFDMEAGFMVERIWIAEGWATAGSASAEAGERPYLQAGRLFIVESDEDVPVFMDTVEMAPKPSQLRDHEGLDGLPDDQR